MGDVAVPSGRVSTSDELQALAARCESEEPSRKLNAEISVACRIGAAGVDRDHWSYRNFPTWTARDDGRVEAGMHWPAPAFTTSLDAAVTLIPEGTEWEMTNLYGIASVEVGLNFSEIESARCRRNDGNLVMALCAAALRGRAAIIKSGRA